MDGCRHPLCASAVSSPCALHCWTCALFTFMSPSVVNWVSECVIKGGGGDAAEMNQATDVSTALPNTEAIVWLTAWLVCFIGEFIKKQLRKNAQQWCNEKVLHLNRLIVYSDFCTSVMVKVGKRWDSMFCCLDLYWSAFKAVTILAIFDIIHVNLQGTDTC